MLIRKLHTDELDLYAAHLKRLTPEDRSSRFSEAHVSDEIIDAYVSRIPQDDLLMGAFKDDVLVAAVHVGLGGGVAEIGISVETDYRGQKLGGELMDHAVQWSRNRHAEKLYTLCSDSNQPMQALAKQVGMSITHDHGSAEAVMPLDPPDVLSMTDEMSADVQEAWHNWTHMLGHVQDLWLGHLSPSGTQSLR